MQTARAPLHSSCQQQRQKLNKHHTSRRHNNFALGEKEEEAPPQTRCVTWDQTKTNHATLHASQSLIRPPDQQGGCSGRRLMQGRLTGRARPRSHPETVHEAKATAAAAANSEGACAKAASTCRCKAAPSTLGASLFSSSHETAKPHLLAKMFSKTYRS